MNGTITSGSSTITPTIILGLSESATGGNMVHPILGRENPDITTRPAVLRTGTLMVGFAGANSETESSEAFNLFRTGTSFTLVGTGRGTLGMAFVVAQGGRISRDLDDDSRDAWTVSIDYQEIVL